MNRYSTRQRISVRYVFTSLCLVTDLALFIPQLLSSLTSVNVTTNSQKLTYGNCRFSVNSNSRPTYFK
jgi:hypothetical protein